MFIHGCSFLWVFAGGADGSLVDFLAHMGKAFGENATIGEECMNTLTEVNLSKSKFFTMIRSAIIVTNVVVGKCTDGVAKLVTKSDITGLKSPKNLTMILEVEAFLEMAWNSALSQIASGKKKADVYKVFGIAAIRATLMIFKKEKSGSEGKKYSLKDISDLFNQELTKGHAELGSASSPSSAKKQTTSQTPISLDEGKDSMFIAKLKLGLEPGSHYTLKDFDNRVWTLESISSTEAVFVFYPLLEPSKKTTVKMSAEELVEKVKGTKSKPPVLLCDDELSNLFPSPNSQEIVKCQCFLALMEVYNTEDVDVGDILVQKQPKMVVFAKKDMKAKSLKLIPCPEAPSSLSLKVPNLANVRFGKCKFQATCFWISAMKPIKLPKAEDPDQTIKGTFAPYWACATGAEDGNLEEKTLTFKTELGEIEVTILVNPAPILAHDPLTLKVTKKSDPRMPDAKRAKRA